MVYRSTLSITFIQTWWEESAQWMGQSAGTTKTSVCARGNLFSPVFKVWLYRKLLQNLQWQPQGGWAFTQLCSHSHIPCQGRVLCTAEGTAPGMALLVDAVAKSISENLGLSLQKTHFWRIFLFVNQSSERWMGFPATLVTSVTVRFQEVP